MARGGVDTRRRILDAALELFCRKGFDATPVSDITQAVGITPPTLYYYFPGKDTLLQALVEPLAGAIDDLIARAPGVESTADTRRTLLSQYLELLLRWRQVVCFMVGDPAVRHHPLVGPRLERQQRLLQQILAGFDSPPAAMVAASAALGALWRPVTSLEPAQLEEHRDVIVDAAVRALGSILP